MENVISIQTWIHDASVSNIICEDLRWRIIDRYLFLQI